MKNLSKAITWLIAATLMWGIACNGIRIQIGIDPDDPTKAVLSLHTNPLNDVFPSE